MDIFGTNFSVAPRNFKVLCCVGLGIGIVCWVSGVGCWGLGPLSAPLSSVFVTSSFVSFLLLFCPVSLFFMLLCCFVVLCLVLSCLIFHCLASCCFVLHCVFVSMSYLVSCLVLSSHVF